ncbi:MAG: hypothetical protein AB7F31_06075 [Parachlamydiales bacterium]
MASTPIYELPDDSSDRFAIAQEAYDRQVAAGLVSPSGATEAAASQATRIRETTSRLNQTELLMGLNQRTSLAYMPPFPPIPYRSTSPLEAPSLGTQERRSSDRQRVMEAALEVSGADRERGMRVALAIEQTIQDNKEIAFVRGRMGEVMAV